jgi:carbonic anhydrase/acetyltransferase-like protein (isoleucine patch superfamily)
MILPFRGIVPTIAPDVFIAETAVVIGDVEIGAGTSVWYGCVVRGDVNRVRIGRNTNIQDGTVIHCNHNRKGDYRKIDGGEPTMVGDNVVVGHLALLHACTIGDGAFIGMRALVMDRAVVEPGAMVAAGATVTPGKVVPAGELWAGTPARRVRALNAKDLAEGPYIAEHYTMLAAEHLMRQRGGGK